MSMIGIYQFIQIQITLQVFTEYLAGVILLLLLLLLGVVTTAQTTLFNYTGPWDSIFTIIL